MALYGVVFLGSTPIGAPIVGVIAERIGAPATVVLTGGLAIAVGALVLARGWRTGRLVGRRLEPPVAVDHELPVAAAEAELPVASTG